MSGRREDLVFGPWKGDETASEDPWDLPLSGWKGWAEKKQVHFTETITS